MDINQAYRGIFKSHLDQEIINSEPSHPYQRASGVSLIERVRAVVSFEDSVRVVIKCMSDPPKYFSKRWTWLRFAQVFQKKCGLKLEDASHAIHEAIPDEDYRDFLVASATTDTAS
ncbi:hypothetical protein QJS10_CPB19g01956 [Acorus calamus]|uniref:Uncharacterized protein n=1 Tax=Acorus calamus TaxID=4465 RepID=A0AAV9CEJ5_ACOCL|nr:hypothetical protein QJS10_CPB19g01956 [Acorus calamus]